MNPLRPGAETGVGGVLEIVRLRGTPNPAIGSTTNVMGFEPPVGRFFLS